MPKSAIEDRFEYTASAVHDPLGGKGLEARLTAEERAGADLVARRLVSELRPLVGLLPESDRGASAMSRLLNVDRATCQRLVAAVARTDAGVDTLVQVPGVMGLRQFIVAVARRELPAGAGERIEAARAAVDRFAELIEQLGGSQRRLRARLDADRAAAAAGMLTPHGGCDDVGVRQAMFRAAAAATGRWCDALIQTVMIRPLPGSPDMTETVHTRAMIGHRARPDAVPLEIGQTAQAPSDVRAGAAGGGGEAQGPSERAPGHLVEEFCSRPLPRIVSRWTARNVVHVVDVPASGDVDAPADIVLTQLRAAPDRHPATLTPPVGEVWRMVSFPARHMIFDVLLHREIACRCIPSLELHLWSPEPSGQHRARWSTRFAGGPKLEMMGAGLERAATRAYPRYTELAAHVMEKQGWNPRELIGYRCEVAYPLWRGGYCMSFDFEGNEMRGPHG